MANFSFSDTSAFNEVATKPDYSLIVAVKLNLDIGEDDIYKVKQAFGKPLHDEVQYRELPLTATAVVNVEGEEGKMIQKKISFPVNLEGAFYPNDQRAYFHPSLDTRDMDGRRRTNEFATKALLQALGMTNGTYPDVVTRLASGAEFGAVFYAGRQGFREELKPMSKAGLTAAAARAVNGVIPDDRVAKAKKAGGGASKEGVTPPAEMSVE